MKKIILLAAVSIMFAFTIQSCGNNKDQNATKKTDSTAVKTMVTDTNKTTSAADNSKKTLYECPMKCDNKTFDKPGKCPECGMTLVPVKS